MVTTKSISKRCHHLTFHTLPCLSRQLTHPNSRLPSLSRQFSSSTPTRPVAWYLRSLDSHPLPTKTITTSLIYAAADLTSQSITMEASGGFDWMRTLRMAGYGLLILGPAQHCWFNWMARKLPKRDLVTTAKKIFLGQAVFGPANTIVFFSYNAALQGENFDEIIARLKRDLLPTLRNGLLYWPVCDFATYKFVPVNLQPLVNSTCSYVWTVYLTYMASLTKASS